MARGTSSPAGQSRSHLCRGVRNSRAAEASQPGKGKAAEAVPGAVRKGAALEEPEARGAGDPAEDRRDDEAAKAGARHIRE